MRTKYSRSYHVVPNILLPLYLSHCAPSSTLLCPSSCIPSTLSQPLCQTQSVPHTMSNPLHPTHYFVQPTVSIYYIPPPPSQSAYNILSPLVPRSLRPKLINFDYIFNPCDILSIILDSPQSPCDISSDTSPQCFRARTTFPVPPASIPLIRYNRTTMS